MDSINKKTLRDGCIEEWDKMTLCSIGANEIGEAFAFSEKYWPKFYSDKNELRYGYKWKEIYEKNRPDTDLFELAIWQEVEGKQVLVAMAIGYPSKARKHLTLRWIERYYGKTHVGGKVLSAILACAEEYVKLLEGKSVLIQGAIDKAPFTRYGYAPYHHPGVPHGGDYLRKEL